MPFQHCPYRELPIVISIEQFQNVLILMIEIVWDIWDSCLSSKQSESLNCWLVYTDYLTSQDVIYAYCDLNTALRHP